MAQLFEELKRRNVFRVGIAYAIVGWLLIEVASVLLPTFEAPESVMQVFALLIILGFPITLVIAWAFEVTPEGIKRDSGADSDTAAAPQTGRKLDFIIIGVLAVAVVYFAVDKFALDGEPEPPRVIATQPPVTEPKPAAASPAREKSIAVLPFVNMSPDPDQEYFSDGLSEEILNLLAKVPDLKVIARTSSFAFRGKNQDIRTIGKALDVSTVLEGSVRKSGERVRITAQLIEVSSGAHLWSETYDRTLTDIFAVQDDVAAEILQALQVHVAAPPKRGRPTENTQAYALFLKGRAKISDGNVNLAEEDFLKAIALDPMFAEAHEVPMRFHEVPSFSRSLGLR